jgi:hypothetical protein
VFGVYIFVLIFFSFICVIKQTSLDCGKILYSGQCSAAELSSFGLACVWVVSSSYPGTGTCSAVAVSCGAIGTDKDMCETPEAAGETASCFWLYGGNEEDTTDAGFCRDKTDESLLCGAAKRKGQCEDGDVDNFGMSNCFWLVGNSSRGELNSVDTGCVDKVCGWKFYYFKFFFFFFYCYY